MYRGFAKVLQELAKHLSPIMWFLMDLCTIHLENYYELSSSTAEEWLDLNDNSLQPDPLYP